MSSSQPPPPGAFFPGRFALWFVASLLVAAGAAWLSVVVQAAGFAPIGVVSVLAGCILGGILLGLAFFIGVGHRPLLIAATVVVAGDMALLQHVLWYQRNQSIREQNLQNNPQAAIMRSVDPDTGRLGFFEYVRIEARRSPATLVLWAVDAALIVLTAVVCVALGTRRSYCNECRSWYRVVRSKTDRGDAARILLPDESILPGDATPAKIQVSRCRAACGPALVRVSWNDNGGRRSVTRWVTADELARWEEAINRR